MESKYPKQKVIAVDVDDTLIIDGKPNYDLIIWLNDKINEGYQLILWSMRGYKHAKHTAQRLGIEHLFQTIMSKPGYIVDDDGWNWTRYTEVISPEMKTVKKKRRATLNSGAAMRRQRESKRSKL